MGSSTYLSQVNEHDYLKSLNMTSDSYFLTPLLNYVVV